MDMTLPPNVVRLRVRGEFKLNREPHGQIEGWDFFHLNASTVDWADSCNAARAQLFPHQPTTPDSDRRYEAMLQWRVEREAAERKEKGRNQ